MPFTPEFQRIKYHYKNLYDDEAKVLTFAFRDAFKLKVPTFRKRTLKLRQNK